MTSGRGKECAQFAMRTLLAAPAPADAAERPPDWGGLLRVARRNVVLLRLAEQLERRGMRAPDFFGEAVRRERRRNAKIFRVVRGVSRACERRGFEFIFAKTFQHYPDAGSDVDLFVASRSTGSDALILEGLLAAPKRRGWRGRLSGAASYRIAGCDAVFEIHHGRLGLLGEHGWYVARLIENGGRARVGGAEFLLPSAEDLLVLQGMQRVCGHGHVRLCDVVSTVKLLRREEMDWPYVFETSRQLGTLHGLRSYLAYVDQIQREALGVGVAAPPQAWGGRGARPERFARVQFKDDFYKFPRLRVGAAIYAGKVRAAVRAGDWGGAGRLCLVPLVAASSALSKVSKASPPGRAPAGVELKG